MSPLGKKMLRRVKVFIVFVLAALVFLSARLAYLQILQHDHYWHMAERNRLRILPITAPRGEIYDRNGVQLVTNRPGFTVSLMDLGSGFDRETISYLSELLEMEEEEILAKINSQYYRRYMAIRLKTDVDQTIVAQIAERRMELPGVVIEVQPIRHYVYDDFAPHLLGYLGEGTVGEATREAWEEQGYQYQVGDLVGQAGLERTWEPFLRGSDGGLQVEVNSTGQAIREFERVEPIPGDNLHLTLDYSLQSSLEAALLEAVQLQQERGNTYAGQAAGVILDPRSGAILAMASLPGYNPNTLRQDYPLLLESSQRPLMNKAIENHYPVGSTFKMVTALAALEERAVLPEQYLYCGGTVTRYGATKSCYRGTVHGPMNLVNALIKSCNIYFYEAGLKVGIDRLAHYAREFGFGQKVGLEDIKGEIEGIVASREFKETLYDEPWYPAETMDAAIGQSFQSITPLQLANYVAMIANGGIHYRPYLVEKIYNAEGEAVYMAEPEVLHQMEVEERTWQILRTAMERVTQPGGTAASLASLPVRVAGKTGTAQVASGDNIPSHGLFVGYAPAGNPEIAFAIIIEHGESGGSSAVPVARRILEHYFGVDNENQQLP